jgi:hypothetical protein
MLFSVLSFRLFYIVIFFKCRIICRLAKFCAWKITPFIEQINHIKAISSVFRKSAPHRCVYIAVAFFGHFDRLLRQKSYILYNCISVVDKKRSFDRTRCDQKSVGQKTHLDQTSWSNSIAYLFSLISSLFDQHFGQKASSNRVLPILALHLCC